MWTLVKGDNRFYQERNQFVYYVYYVSSVNVDNYLANVDNQTPMHMQFIAKS